MDMNLKIDPEFQGKIPPLTSAEYEQLKENILSAGEIYEPLVVWNGTIVDGHNRYKIIQEHPEIKWRVREIQFADKWEAFDWMYKNQLGRRNLTDEQRTYLLGKLYEARKHVHGETQTRDENGKFRWRQNDANGEGRTREQIMKEQGVGQKTVERSEYYAHGIDAIREKEPELAESILTAKTKVKKADVQAVGKASAGMQKDMIEKIKNGERIKEETPVSTKKRSEGATRQNRADCAEIRSMISDIEEESAMEYTIDNLTNQISVNADAFIRSLSNLIMDHTDICNEHPDQVVLTIEEHVTKRIDQIKERLSNGTQL